MHPALSIIFFTTASGAGYGLLVLIAWGALVGHLAPQANFGICAFGTALGLMIVAMVSAWWPSYRAARLNVVEALRHA